MASLNFISGLPRSGSTLLAALLRQNPRFEAGISSPLAQIIMRVQHAMSRGSEGAVLVSDSQRKRILRGIFANYYAGGRDSIFDTNRAWCAKMPLVAELFPNAKVICCVRVVGWIMNSVEKLIQSNPCELSGLFGFSANSTVYDRVNALANSDGLVGYAMNALREAYFGPFANRLLLLDYHALVVDPAQAMKFIYDFLGKPVFRHDFKKFEYQAQEFDLTLGTPGLHKVTGPVRWIDQKPVIPPDLFLRFAGDAFWRDQTQNFRRVPVVMFSPNKLQAVGA